MTIFSKRKVFKQGSSLCLTVPSELKEVFGEGVEVVPTLTDKGLLFCLEDGFKEKLVSPEQPKRLLPLTAEPMYVPQEQPKPVTPIVVSQEQPKPVVTVQSIPRPKEESEEYSLSESIYARTTAKVLDTILDRVFKPKKETQIEEPEGF